MFVGRINKQNPDVSRFTVDLTPWLDDGEIVTDILTHTITLGTTGWSNTPFPVPGNAPPYDPTPLLFTEVQLVDDGTAVEVYVSFGTPGNVYTCQFEVVGTTLREVAFEVGVHISGTPPASVSVVPEPLAGGLSIYGGQLQGPLYLYRDPTYPTEASTKQYVDFAISLQQVPTKVNRAGDNMAGFLTLYADPVQPMHAVTKNYVDVQTGSTLHDAPSDGFYYGRRNLDWTRVVEEATLDTFGYLRSNGAWIRGVFQSAAATVDVRVTDNNVTNTPVLSGMQTPFSAATDVFFLSARRTGTGAMGDGGVVQLFGPLASAPNAVNIYAGTRAAAKVWSFLQTGALSAPGQITAAGPIDAAGSIRSSTGRLIAYTNDASQPSVMAWDQAHNVASGFWTGASGALGFGQLDGNGLPVTAWMTLSSSGMNTTSLSTSANVSVGTSLNVGTSLVVGTSLTVVAGINAANIGLTGNLTAANASLTGDLTSNRVITNLVSSSGGISSGGTVAGQVVSSNTDVYASNNLSVGQNVYAVGANMVMGSGASGRLLQMTPNWYLDFHTTDGKLGWVANGSDFWVMSPPDAYLCYNNIGTVAGHGAYIVMSDARLKTDIEDTENGLACVLGLSPKSYRRLSRTDGVPMDAPELGFVAQDVQQVFPEAVVSLQLDASETPTLAIDTMALTAALVNAVKELDARVQTLETH